MVATESAPRHEAEEVGEVIKERCETYISSPLPDPLLKLFSKNALRRSVETVFNQDRKVEDGESRQVPWFTGVFL